MNRREEKDSARERARGVEGAFLKNGVYLRRDAAPPVPVIYSVLLCDQPRHSTHQLRVDEAGGLIFRT